MSGPGTPLQSNAVLWSRSWSRKEPELLAGAGMLKFQFPLRLPAPAPGKSQVVFLIIIRIEQDQKSELSQYSLQKVMKNLVFHLKAVKTGTGTQKA
jgi:hypothetical protein